MFAVGYKNTRVGLVAPLLWLCAGYAAAADAPAPVKIAVFPFELQISDARSGGVISRLASELRMGADYSWSRGARSVIQNNLLPAQAAKSAAAEK